VRIYLDTNIVHSWFRKLMESLRRAEPFEEPSVVRFVFAQ